ncbi:MAG: hypothetical protein HC794_04365 [Nitrospiraceae bacterium]|nr:hypothetical protein [Nitrospiraceae bacterium]
MPAQRPAGLSITLYAGDGQPTDETVRVAADGRLFNPTRGPGDGTVTRDSALMDERVGGTWSPMLVTPIDLSDVNFMFTNHLGLTTEPMFADNILHLLLESPRRGTGDTLGDPHP